MTRRWSPTRRKTIDEGAVAPWGMFGLAVMPQVVAEFGVRTDVPYRELTDHEQEIVLDGPAEKRQIRVPSKSGKLFDLNFTYRSARQAVRESLNNATSEKGLARVNRFITTHRCPACSGTRLSARARGTQVSGVDLAEASAKTLAEMLAWVPTIPATLPADLRPMAEMITGQFTDMGRRLVELGLGYLTLDRASSTLSTGERQRVQLARAVRNETTGVLYVLDEPSIGLHPANIEGLIGVMRDLVADGNSVVLVDHDVQVLREADWMIEIGPGSGSAGGSVLAQGTIARSASTPSSLIGGFLAGRGTGHSSRRRADRVRAVRPRGDPAVDHARSTPCTRSRPTFPKGRLTAVTGMSGSGKTTLVLDSLVPALAAAIDGEPLPAHVTSLDPAGATRADVVDATPIGTNVRSTVATYSGILDDLRRAYAATPAAQGARPERRRLLLQHRVPPVPPLRGHRPGRPRRPVPPRRRHPLPRLRRHPVLPRRRRDPRWPPTEGDRSLPQLLGTTVAEAADLLSPDAEGAQEAADPDRPRARLPHPGRGHPCPLRRRGPAAEARSRARPQASPARSSSSTSPPSACTRWTPACS